jgi:hypothetical protein
VTRDVWLRPLDRALPGKAAETGLRVAVREETEEAWVGTWYGNPFHESRYDKGRWEEVPREPEGRQ